MSVDLGMNLKPGINFCAPVETIGFRGISQKGLARLIPLADEKNKGEEIFFFFGVDVPSSLLPYIPDMGPGSAFASAAGWHFFKIKWGIFISHLTWIDSLESFEERELLQAVLFEGEKKPRIFVDKRADLVSEGILTTADSQRINEILTAKKIEI